MRVRVRVCVCMRVCVGVSVPRLRKSNSVCLRCVACSVRVPTKAHFSQTHAAPTRTLTQSHALSHTLARESTSRAFTRIERRRASGSPNGLFEIDKKIFLMNIS